jgi:hypothetical protein
MGFGHLHDKGVAALFAALCVGGVASAQSRPARDAPAAGAGVPMPPARPPELREGPPQSPSPVEKPVAEPAQGDDCRAALNNAGFDAETAAAPSGAQCAIDTPVRLLRLRGNGDKASGVEFPERPILACRFALKFGQWAKDLAAPLAVGTLGVALKAVHTGPGAQCRTRNHIPGAKISAHASGAALDIADFVLADGRRIPVVNASDDAVAQFLSALRTAACGWFTTILGPGSDPFHATHWHFDVKQHGSSLNYRICQ